MRAPFNEGDRVVLTQMNEDPYPVQPGTLGTVTARPIHFGGSWQVSVDWDNGRTLDLVMPPDEATRL
jgi:hypothetical protein